MAELAPDPAFQKFVRQYWSTLTVGGRADALRVANADFVGRLREMFARRQAEGPGLFLDVAGGSIVAPRRRGRRPVADEAGARCLYATRWSSPALGGARLVPRAADSAADDARRRAEALVLGAVRLCDGEAPLDTLVVARDALGAADALWRALRLLSNGQFGAVPTPPARAARADARAAWLKAAGFFGLGQFVASRLDVSLTAARTVAAKTSALLIGLSFTGFASCHPCATAMAERMPA